MTDIYQYVNIYGCPKKYFTKFHPCQRPSETKGMTHDDITYPMYWKNYQKCTILGKSSKHLRFIFVSCLSQKIDFSLEGGVGAGQRTSNYLFCRLPSLCITGGYPACKGPFQITLHSCPPDLSNQSAIFVGQ